VIGWAMGDNYKTPLITAAIPVFSSGVWARCGGPDVKSAPELGQ
jgi:hypothetical protein